MAALEIAIGKGHRELAEYLVSRGAKVTRDMINETCKRTRDSVNLVRALVDAI